MQDLLNDKQTNFTMNKKLYDPYFWETYLFSYGTAIAQFNLGAARAMQMDVNSTNTVCFEKAVMCSNTIQHIFDLSLYEHGYFNLADFWNFLQVMQVHFLDQYYACELNHLVSRIQSKFEVAYGRFPIYFFTITNKGYINLVALCVKMLATVAVIMVAPDWTSAFTGYRYIMTFFLNGGFQNLGAGLMLLLQYATDYEAPIVYRALQPYYE